MCTKWKESVGPKGSSQWHQIERISQAVLIANVRVRQEQAILGRHSKVGRLAMQAGP